MAVSIRGNIPSLGCAVSVFSGSVFGEAGTFLAASKLLRVRVSLGYGRSTPVLGKAHLKLSASGTQSRDHLKKESLETHQALVARDDALPRFP